jgi:thymidylate synthase
MITWEQQYLDLVEDILRNGDDRVDRTGVGTRAVFGRHMDINLQDGFPAVTTKKLAWKAVVSELLWFLEGSSDERRLAEILHGTRDSAKQTIWTANAQADYWKPKAKFDGDLGPVYGNQWRHWKTYKTETNPYGEHSAYRGETTFRGPEIDQIAELIKKLKTNNTDRRMIISAWNVAELNNVALPPCHMMAQFFVEKDRLSCSMYQRSVDTMLGLPFNIASYALLTHMLARVASLDVGRLIMNLGDTHIYLNHLEGAKTQLDRTPTAAPTLIIRAREQDIDGFVMNDFELLDYSPQASIKMEMAV